VPTVQLSTAATARRLTQLLGLADCWFEAWPYDRQLPTMARGRVILPADEPGTRGYSEWSTADGVGLPEFHAGLEIGRFVLLPRIPTVGIAWPPELRARALALVEDLREGSATWLTS
jgi:hypothetical protein